MGWRRLGGQGTTVDGDTVVWSTAEGSRGTRWRETRLREDHLRHALVLEVAPSGQVTRLEVATPAGLLTLHPEPGRSALHGNVVTPDGVVHLGLRWEDDALLLVVASPTVMSVVLRGMAATIGVGERAERPAVHVGDGLRPVAGSWTIERLDASTWRLRPVDGGPDWTGIVGSEPGPVLSGATTWPLEIG